MYFYRYLMPLVVAFLFSFAVFSWSIAIADSDYEDYDYYENRHEDTEHSQDSGERAEETAGNYIIIAYNDLGMHCTNADHSVSSILPPYNTLVAQVIQRGEAPRIVTQGITVEYRLLQNTTCQGMNFWDYAGQIFGVDLPFWTGLTGKTLAGAMELESKK